MEIGRAAEAIQEPDCVDLTGCCEDEADVCRGGREVPRVDIAGSGFIRCRAALREEGLQQSVVDGSVVQGSAVLCCVVRLCTLAFLVQCWDSMVAGLAWRGLRCPQIPGRG
jgi:hypothetical protein